ncbi:MAG: hypothetical protein JNL92_24860, partial [Opitutaceae bacterium]|nr:hypothetical protein [Opitutaceae bacterium]
RYDDRSFCAPGNAYKVTAIYFDGRKSESGVVSDPFSVQPTPLSVVRAVQSGPLEVTVTWVAEVDEAGDPQLGHTYRRYLIKGPSLPPEGRLIDPPITREWFRLPNAQMKYGPVSGSEQRRVVLTGVPLGRHEVRVFTDYGLGNVNLISPQAAVAAVEVQRWDGAAASGATLPGPVAPATRKGPAPVGGPGPATGATKTEVPPASDRPATLRTAAPGPAPVNFRVEPLPPAQAGHVFRWQTVGDYQSRSIYRRDGDQWIFMIGDPNDASQVWNPSPTWEDTLVLPDRWVIPGTVFKLEIRFKDGRRSEAELTYANPPQPVMPVVFNLRAEQTGHRRVRVSWTRRPPYSGRANEALALESPGLPGGAAYSEVSEGVADQWMDIHNVPEGRHTFKIGLQEIWGKLLPGAAHTTIDVRPVGDRVRVVLLGFRVGRKTTDDDVLDGDGRGDEVYFTSYQASVPVAAGALNVAPLGFVESVVIGDTNNFPSRQRGGTAGPTGGIRSGDAVPSAAALAPQPGLTPTRDRLPLLLWEGTLDRRLSAKVIGLTGWEWDPSPAVALSGVGATWRDFWALGSTMDVMRDAARVATNFPTNGVRYQPLAPVGALHRYEGTFTRGGTRPLGGLRSGPQTWECVAQGIVLTLENVEHLLGASAAAIVEAPLGMQRRPDGRQVDAGERDESEYTAILQVERLPMRPEEIGRAAGPWVVERHRPAGAVNERNIMTPLEAAGARRGEKLGK